MIGKSRFSEEVMRFTASVMGNPEYINQTKRIKQAPDERHQGLEKLNSYHAAKHTERKAKEKADARD